MTNASVVSNESIGESDIYGTTTTYLYQGKSNHAVHIACRESIKSIA